MTGAAGRPAPRWFLIQAKARQERRAAEHLENQGYTCFLPEIRCEKVRQGQRIEQLEPLFPNYVFIRLIPGVDSVQPIRSTRGVIKLVAFGGVPLAVPDDIIDTLKSTVSAQYEPAPLLKKGDPLTVRTGHTYLDAIFQEYDGDARVVVLLTLLQKTQSVRVALDQIVISGTRQEGGQQ